MGYNCGISPPLWAEGKGGELLFIRTMGHAPAGFPPPPGGRPKNLDTTINGDIKIFVLFPLIKKMPAWFGKEGFPLEFGD